MAHESAIWSAWVREARIIRPRRRAQRIARMFNVSTRTVWDIVRERRAITRRNRALRLGDIIIT